MTACIRRCRAPSTASAKIAVKTAFVDDDKIDWAGVEGAWNQ